MNLTPHGKLIEFLSFCKPDKQEAKSFHGQLVASISQLDGQYHAREISTIVLYGYRPIWYILTSLK